MKALCHPRRSQYGGAGRCRRCYDRDRFTARKTFGITDPRLAAYRRKVAEQCPRCGSQVKEFYGNRDGCYEFGDHDAWHKGSYRYWAA